MAKIVNRGDRVDDCKRYTVYKVELTEYPPGDEYERVFSSHLSIGLHSGYSVCGKVIEPHELYGREGAGALFNPAECAECRHWLITAIAKGDVYKDMFGLFVYRRKIGYTIEGGYSSLEGMLQGVVSTGRDNHDN